MRLRAAALSLLLTTEIAAAACAPDAIVVETANGAARFSVEIADTPEERGRGLMFRARLPDDAGMLFIFQRVGPVAFWMKNTPESLDMLFFSPDGRVCGLVERAEPLSLEARPSGCPTRAVLEVRGGLAAELGVSVGARARHEAFGPDAAWPCAE